MNLPPTQAGSEADGVQQVVGPSKEQVAELLRLLMKSLRAHRLYQPNNPVFQRFVSGLAASFDALWDHCSSLHLVVDEDGFEWEGNKLPAGDERDDLAFFFYKDGVRYLTFYPGFEEDVPHFLGILHQASEQAQHDDLLTLLWQAELASFRYGHVDPLGSESEAEEKLAELGEPATFAGLTTELAKDAEEGFAAMPVETREVAEGEGKPISSITREEFDETLYFLDPSEIAALEADVAREWERDLKKDVLNALLDRLEDLDPDGRREILGILRQLLLAFLVKGDMEPTADLLEGLQGIVSSDALPAELSAEAEGVLADLSEPTHLEHVAALLEKGILDVGTEAFGIFLRHLRPTALGVLIRLVQTTENAALRESLLQAVEVLSREHGTQVSALIDSSDAAIATGAARLAGRLGLSESTPRLAGLLRAPDPDLRLAAVAALAELRSGPALQALQLALDDGNRDVRIAAVGVFGKLRYRPARRRLEEVIQGRRLKDADLTEKLAVFEAYGALGAPESVPVLDQLLNGRDLLRRPQPAEMRACAAVALGILGSPAARSALQRATNEKDPVVQHAVARALQQEQAT